MLILSSSHFHVENLSTLDTKTLFTTLFHHNFAAFPGLPNTSPLVKRYATSASCWLVGDYRFGNSNPSGAVPRVFNVSKLHVTPEIDIEMAKHSIAAIDSYLNLPTLTPTPTTATATATATHHLHRPLLLFWDLAVREAMNNSSDSIYSGTTKFSYSNLVNRYKSNVVDIRKFCDDAGLTFKDLVRDRGGHPNDLGVAIIIKAISAAGAAPIITTTTPKQNNIHRYFVFACRFALCKYHTFVRGLIAPIQKKMTLVRPRLKLIVNGKYKKIKDVSCRSKRVRLRLSHVLLNVYQAHVLVLTALSGLVELRITDFVKDLAR